MQKSHAHPKYSLPFPHDTISVRITWLLPDGRFVFPRNIEMIPKIYGAITGKIDYVHDTNLTLWRERARKEHKSLNYYIKKKIITENLFGVDLMEEGTEIAKLRLFLALVSSAQSVEQLEPLPNIDFNILPGNSLIGLLHVNAEIYNKRLAQLNLFQKRFEEVVAEKNQRIRDYKDASTYTKDLRDLRDSIHALRHEAIANLNELLLDEFKQLGVKYEQATWDSSKQTDGKSSKRAVTLQDIAHLQPFHWGYEFDRVMERGGFDIIITNPPWEALKPQAKEFFALHSELVSKNKMRIEDFEKEQNKLLQNPEIRNAWLSYQNSFPYQSLYFRATAQYENQISTVNGKKQGTDINLYKLFTEQCYNLLREGGECGIVIPSGIYTDLGAKQLRELLFSKAQITGLFCFENNKAIFENVHRSFKFVVLTYEKGGQTETFPTAFMRHHVAELERFPKTGALEMSVELIRRLSPDSLSVMEFKDEMDMDIAQRMLRFQALGARPAVKWNFTLTNEFHMTNDSGLFQTIQKTDYWPLYEGKMIHQYIHSFSKPRYWIDSQQGKQELINQEMRRIEEAIDKVAILQGSISKVPSRQERVAIFLKNLGCSPLTAPEVRIAPDAPRLVCRSIARNTDQRTLIATILPSYVFTGNSLNYLTPWYFEAEKLLDKPSKLSECYIPTFSATSLAYLCGVMNSYTLDHALRSKVSANVNMFYLYQLPVPRLADDEPRCIAIATRVAQLICIGPEFDELRQELLGDVNAHVATDVTERKQLQAEIDGLVAHLYGLTEDEFVHVLKTFPLVDQKVKDAALEAYRKFALEPENLAIAELIAQGENDRVEFKVAACWNAKQNRKDDAMVQNVIQEVAAFLNSREGGTVLVGVEDDKTVAGLADDYRVANAQKQDRDGYQLYLLDMLKNTLESNCGLLYKISFGTIQGKDVCRIDVTPASEEVYVKGGDFYVREGNRKRKLTAKETVAYIRQRWG